MTSQLDAILHEIQSRLESGATNRKSPMHTPIVGTADGALRIMVLRHFDTETGMLRFHTDARSPKVAAIARDPAVHVLAYDPEARVQIRMGGIGRVECDGLVADAAWAASTTFARRCYLLETAPGAPSVEPTSGLPEWAEGINPAEDQITLARENFAVLLVEVQRFDWLFLSNDGHRRAIFEDGAGHWVVP